VGRTHFCRIEGKPLAQANEWLENYRKVWEANFERLDDGLLPENWSSRNESLSVA
jgi:hypothetical protein